jgi:hypothetical protein
MGWRLRKTIRVGKVFRVNLSRRGVSYGASIPGTGLTWSGRPGSGRKPRPKDRGSSSGWLVLLGLVAAGLILMIGEGFRAAFQQIFWGTAPLP